MRSGPSVVLPARPEAIRLDAATTAVIVVDMQNAYASKGGYVDEAGFDVGPAASVIPKIAEVVEVARTAGMPVVFLQNGWDAGYVEAGTPLSPNYHKSNALRTMRARPELAGKFLARGGWDYELVEALGRRAMTCAYTSRAIRRSSTRNSIRCCARAESAR